MRAASQNFRRRDLLTAALLFPALRAGIGRAWAEQDPGAIDRQIGEMIVVGFVGDAPEASGAKAVAEWLRAGLVGGVIFYEDNLPNLDRPPKR